MLVGGVPFTGKTVLDVYGKIQNDPVVIERKMDPRVSRLIYAMLEKDHAKRPTIQEVRSYHSSKDYSGLTFVHMISPCFHSFRFALTLFIPHQVCEDAWVTNGGKEPLKISGEERKAVQVSEDDVEKAVTRVSNLCFVVFISFFVLSLSFVDSF